MNIFATLLSMIYFATLLRVMYTNANSMLITSVQQGYFSATESVKQKDGFQVAFGFISNGESEFLNYELSASVDVFGEEDKQITLDLHVCSQEELDSFYPITESQKEDFAEAIDSDFFCFDYSQLELFGSISSS